MFKTNSYNKALSYQREIRKISGNQKKRMEVILNVIKYAKLAIEEKAFAGDAHILLADAYTQAALTDFPGENYSRYLPFAAAVIYHWKTHNLFTQEKAIGEQVFRGISEQLKMDVPEWMGAHLESKDFAELHKQYYELAII